MKRRNALAASLCCVAAAALTFTADRVLGEVDMQPASCCFTQNCGNQSATACVGPCPQGWVCTGNGGCEPSPWAEAGCMRRPPVVDPVPDPGVAN